MPLYQLFAIAKPTVPLSALATAMRRIGNTVFSSGGTLQDIRSYGEQALAYEIKTQTGKYAQVRLVILPEAASCICASLLASFTSTRLPFSNSSDHHINDEHSFINQLCAAVGVWSCFAPISA